MDFTRRAASGLSSLFGSGGGDGDDDDGALSLRWPSSAATPAVMAAT